MATLDLPVVVVFALVLAALISFATEPVPADVTAIGVMVALLLVGPVTEALASVGLLAAPIELITVSQGLSGFASTATVTVLAMFVLSAGVQRTGVVQMLGAAIGRYTGDDETRQLATTTGIVAPISGFINNTAAVAILLPMVSDLAHDGGTSPSKLLIPLSYASMVGGTLTLIGTSTNILAAAVATDLAPAVGARFTMFVFTPLGLVLTLVGLAYLLTVGRWLLPERIRPRGDLTEEFEIVGYLTEIEIREDSPMVGETVAEALAETEFDLDVVQLVRGEEAFADPAQKTIRPGDVFALRVDRDTLIELLDVDGIDPIPEVTVDEAELEAPNERENLVEVVVAPGSALVGESLADANFRQRYDATVLAMRRGDELIRRRMDGIDLQVGDALLIQGTPDAIERLDANPDFIVAQEIERQDYREDRIPVALGIVAAVVGLAAIGALSIAVSALAGALAMVLTGCLRPQELYDAVQWDVIFLLAGVIPLGVAMQTSGAAAVLAEVVVASAAVVPPIAVLGLLYLATALLTNVISNNASVVLMIPVSLQVATELAGNPDPFPFVLAVTFAASTAFMTPVGYQTNLFVYGPGGYRFTDYLRVGAPLQAIFAVVTTVGIWVLFPPFA